MGPRVSLDWCGNFRPLPGFVRQTDYVILANADIYGMVERQFIKMRLVGYIIAFKWFAQ